MKYCKLCKQDKPASEYYRQSTTLDGLHSYCKECHKMQVTSRRNKQAARWRAYDMDRQRNDFTRIFKHRHRNMRSRVEGRRSDRSFKVEGMPMADQTEFLEWCRSPATMTQFFRLWINWRNAGYCRALTPSIDRIDNRRGYTVDNMQWLSLRDNDIKGTK